MNAPILIATAVAAGPSLAIPGPYWLFTLLHWLTFVLHLIAMNLLLGGLLVFLIAGSSPLRKLLFDAQTRLFPTLMAATITLGVAPLLFVQVIYGRLFYSASIVSAWNWFLIVPVLLVVYYLLYASALAQKLSPPTKLVLLVVAATGLVYISYTFTMISDLAEKPHLWGELYQASPQGLSLNPSYVETIFRWLHTLAGALAVAGIGIMYMALYHPKIRPNRQLLAFGGRIFMLGVIKAAVFGTVYLFTLDKPIFTAFLASPGLHAILSAIILNVVAVFLIYKAAGGGEQAHLKLWTAALLVLAALLCMVIGRHVLRLVYLNGYFNPADLATRPQWPVFGVFLAFFIIGLMAFFWMLRRYFSSRNAETQAGPPT